MYTYELLWIILEECERVNQFITGIKKKRKKMRVARAARDNKKVMITGKQDRTTKERQPGKKISVLKIIQYL